MKTVKDLSNEQLSNAITASLLSYNAYLEESAQIQQDLTIDEFKKSGVIKAQWEKVISSEYYKNHKFVSIKDFSKLAAHFYANFYREHKKEESEIFRAVMDVNSVKFPEKDPMSELLPESIADTQTIINRELWKFLKNESNIPAFKFLKIEQEKQMLSYLEKESVVIKGLLSTEKDYIDSIYTNQIKASMLTKHIIKDFIAIDENMIGISKHGTLDNKKDYFLDNGIFHVGTREDGFGASFGAFLEEKDGKKILHISFRGTEIKSKSMLKYFLYDYQNMERHYNTMKPLIEQVISEMEKTHVKLDVKVSGHSLGAAMVEEFLNEHPDTENLKFTGVALASPRATHKMQSIVNLLEKNQYLKHGTILLNAGIGVTSLILRKIEKGITSVSQKSKHLSFLKLGGILLDRFFPNEESDPRLLNIDHENDIVPKVGTLVYKSQKEKITLLHKNQDEVMKDHKVYNYFGELAAEAIRREDMFATHKELFVVESAFSSTKYIKTSNERRFQQINMDNVLKTIEQIQREIASKSNSNSGNLKPGQMT